MTEADAGLKRTGNSLNESQATICCKPELPGGDQDGCAVPATDSSNVTVTQACCQVERRACTIQGTYPQT
jgi:hypothetical protein